MIELIQIYDEDLGFLPVIRISGKEVYRGEYQSSIAEAMEKIMVALKRLELEHEQ